MTWSSAGSYGTDTSGASVQGQLYDASGNPVGGEFQVNPRTRRVAKRHPDWQWTPKADSSWCGTALVRTARIPSGQSIQGQRYDANGTRVGGEFQVNSYITSGQRVPAVAIGSEGNFVVVWESYGSHGTDTSSWSAQGQRYAANGALVGGQFQVNFYTADQQDRVKVVSTINGNFVVVWESYGSDGTDTSYLSVQGLHLAPQIFANGFESGDTSSWSAVVQ